MLLCTGGFNIFNTRAKRVGVGRCGILRCNTTKSNGAGSTFTVRRTVSSYTGDNKNAIILRDNFIFCDSSIHLGDGIGLRVRGNTILGTASGVSNCVHPGGLVGSPGATLVNGPMANGPDFIFVCNFRTSGYAVDNRNAVSTGNRTFIRHGSRCCIANRFCPHPAIVCVRGDGRVAFGSFIIGSTPF